MVHIITKKSANFAHEHLGRANKVFRLTRGGRKIDFESPNLDWVTTSFLKEQRP